MIVADFTVFFPWLFLRHLITTLFFYSIIHAFVKDKYNSVLTCGIYCVVALAWVWFADTIYTGRLAAEYVYLLVYVIIIFLLTVFLTEGKMILKIISVILALLFETLSISTFTTLTHIGTETQLPLVMYASYLGFWMCSAFVWIALVRMVTNRFKKNKSYNNKYLVYYIYPITHMVLFMLLAHFFSAVNNSMIKSIEDAGMLEIVISVFAGVCILADIALIFIIDHNQETEDRALKSEKELLKTQMSYEQALMLKKEKEELGRVQLGRNRF